MVAKSLSDEKPLTSSGVDWAALDSLGIMYTVELVPAALFAFEEPGRRVGNSDLARLITPRPETETEPQLCTNFNSEGNSETALSLNWTNLQEARHFGVERTMSTGWDGRKAW